MTTMKTYLSYILSSLIVTSVVGCSTSSSKVASTHPASTATELADGKLLYEMGKLDLAEQKLEAVLRAEPDNAKARYYLVLVHQNQQRRENGQERPWGYYQTFPQQPIYR